jgi:nucleosome-remodeling factor subunit BPTF
VASSAGRSGTPSSKSSSRATSPASSAAGAPTRSSSRKKGGGNGNGGSSVSATATPSRRATMSGSNTPASRASRSSSVASNGHNTAATNSANRTVPKLKIKVSKDGRGYNPSMVNYKDSEYHYGSDFEDDGDEAGEDAESVNSDSSSDLDDSRESDAELEVESDVDLDNIVPESRPVTPLPFWLRTAEEADGAAEEVLPDLLLPPCSDDLLVPSNHVLQVFSVYEILRRFHQILRLTPFRIEDFCAAIASDEQSNLLSEVHVALLRTLVRADEANGTTFGPMDQKDSVNAVFFFMDSFTWPECLRSYLQSDPILYAEPLEVMSTMAPEYPLASPDKLVESRVKVLSFLADQILLTSIVRDFIVDDGHIATEEHCRVCHRLGEMLVCDTCPGVYHLGCLDPPLQDVPEDEWRCYVCQANDVEGVTDCPPQPPGKKGQSSCRQDALGFDRRGNKYWFLCRRMVVELNEENGGGIKYYSSVKQLEELSEVLDDEVYESELWDNMEDQRIEIERQMEVTEQITNSKKAASRRSYFDQENGEIRDPEAMYTFFFLSVQ